MREEIRESVSRMSAYDCKDVWATFNIITPCSKTAVRQAAYADEDIAEYVLNY